METLSQDICKLKEIDVKPGDVQGTCCLCGQETMNGFKKKFGGNFTAGPEVSMGDCICEYCIHLIKLSNELRRSMWLVTEHEYRRFKKDEAKDVVLNLPDEPFYLYLTNTWQKVGWIKMLNLVNQDKNSLICCCVDYDTYFIELEVMKNLLEFVEELRELKIPKAELETGELSMHHYKKLETPRETARKLKGYAGNPVWKLAVYLNK